MNEKYENIINLPHHVSKSRSPMSRYDRAAQFAPYSALSGYEDAVEETARLTDRRIELDEYEKEKINASLSALFISPIGTEATFTFFRPDRRKEGGSYITVRGKVARYDEIRQEICLIGGYKIKMCDVIEIGEIANQKS